MPGGGGVCMEEGSGMGVSPYRGPLGYLGRGVHLPGTLKISQRRVLAVEHLSLYGSSVREEPGGRGVFLS
jgi:hypothetical protein